jgi:hypothetical protein
VGRPKVSLKTQMSAAFRTDSNTYTECELVSCTLPAMRRLLYSTAPSGACFLLLSLLCLQVQAAFRLNLVEGRDKSMLAATMDLSTSSSFFDKRQALRCGPGSPCVDGRQVKQILEPLPVSQHY